MSESEATAGSLPSVLVVDEEEGVREVLALALRAHGFNVLLASDGREAVELYCQHRIAVVLSDVEMPGMDGSALLAALRQIDPQVGCCFMIGGDFRRNDLLRLGAVEFFAKPLKLAEIVGFLRGLVREQRP